MEFKLTLLGRIPSKKNSKVRTGRRLISSKQYLEREKTQKEKLEEQIGRLGITEKIRMEYKFYMPDNRRTDLSNKVESINDLLVDYGLLEDDNRTIIQELNIKCEGVDKTNPRVEITITLLDNQILDG